jgi:hypothetical protein
VTLGVGDNLNDQVTSGPGDNETGTRFGSVDLLAKTEVAARTLLSF